MYKILIIEDEYSIRSLIRIALQKHSFEIDFAENGQEGLKKIKQKNYDLVLLDLMLPKVTGLQFCKQVRNEKYDFYIIMLTAMDAEEDKLRGFQYGADDYITKPFSPELLLARINAGLRRIPKPKDEAVFGEIKLNRELQILTTNAKKQHLTTKEFDLIHYLIQNQKRFVSRDELLGKLWGFSYDGDTRIVDVHISKLRQHISGSKVQIITKRGVGYMIKVVEDEI